MLTDINIKHFGLFDALDLPIESGLCILTGASGSGKSILIEAIAFALGHHSGKNYLQEKPMEVSLSFNLDPGEELLGWFESNGLEWDSQCIIRRVLSPGKNPKSFVNDSLITTQNIKKLSPFLIGLHGQHSNLQLLKTSYQHQCLDNYGETSQLALDVKQSYETLMQLIKEKETWDIDSQSRLEQLDWTQYQINELSSLNPLPNEVEELELKRQRLSQLEQCSTLCQDILTQLDPILAKPKHPAVNELLTSFPELDNIHRLIESIELQAQESQHELNRILPTLCEDLYQTETIDKRLSELYDMARKHRCQPHELSFVLDKLVLKNQAISDEQQQNNYPEKISQAEHNYHQLSQVLSKKRQLAAKKLILETTQSLSKIGFAKGTFEVHFQTHEQPHPHGHESAAFWIQTNPGHPLAPIQSISGGEMSRLHLLLQSILPVSQPKCLIFDEVDVGISGAIAAVIGELLYTLAHHYQALCITHLPQVACQGTQHLQITKKQASKSTTLHITHLNKEERIHSIASLLSGHTVTEATLTQAKHLLENQLKLNTQEVAADAS
ncbi:MAG TPA: DNA repair protein RecN [Gammaproteobacteria bacterium]|nr:DNA repair protein RecN [Gammaproteobacteria bacterium]